jgi:hypothetical protein
MQNTSLRKLFIHMSLRHIKALLAMLDLNDTVLYESKYSHWTVDYIAETKTLEITWMYRNTVRKVYIVPFNESE